MFPRDEFLKDYFDYKSGEHLTIVSPTDGGKTYLMNQLLAEVATPDLQAVVLVMKPRDSTSTEFAKKNHFDIVTTWPPPKRWFKKKPPGYVVWPKHSFDPDIDDAAHYDLFRRVILDCYKRGDRILAADEMFGLIQDLKLTRPVVTVLTRGRSMDCGLWTSTQRPRGIPLEAYSQSEHLFLGNTPDENDRDRYAEIGGFDPRLISEATAMLDEYQFLYIKRGGKHMCIVDK